MKNCLHYRIRDLSEKIKRKIRRQNISNAERLKNYNELEKGTMFVHQVHGIGQYLGIEND